MRQGGLDTRDGFGTASGLGTGSVSPPTLPLGSRVRPVPTGGRGRGHGVGFPPSSLRLTSPHPLTPPQPRTGVGESGVTQSGGPRTDVSTGACSSVRRTYTDMYGSQELPGVRRSSGVFTTGWSPFGRTHRGSFREVPTCGGGVVGGGWCHGVPCRVDQSTPVFGGRRKADTGFSLSTTAASDGARGSGGRTSQSRED